MSDKYASKARTARKAHQSERCRRKRAFPDERSAHLHNRGQRPYHCANCGSWHLASYKVRNAIRMVVGQSRDSSNRMSRKRR